MLHFHLYHLNGGLPWRREGRRGRRRVGGGRRAGGDARVAGGSDGTGDSNCGTVESRHGKYAKVAADAHGIYSVAVTLNGVRRLEPIPCPDQERRLRSTTVRVRGRERRRRWKASPPLPPAARRGAEAVAASGWAPAGRSAVADRLAVLLNLRDAYGNRVKVAPVVVDITGENPSSAHAHASRN